ncbi:MAG: acyl-CoA dehydrogenase family protein [Clostridiales bacterium]|nr:acyl-CoA dehydrogenase family protein [Clostridiales bacterium]
MDFHFTEEEQRLLAQIHEFAVNEVAPLAAELDEQERFPSEAFKRLGEMNLMGVCYPKEVGGGGHSYLAYIAMVEELAKYCATTSIMFAAHHSLGAYALSVLGTPEQKEKYLLPLMKGQKLGAFGCTEPGAGTDLGGGQRTKAEDKGDHWLLNGSKIFITNGYYADIYFISAVTDPSQRTRGISAFVVEKGTPGFTFGKKEKKMGIRGSATYELVFQDCKIPKENLLGELGKGFKTALTTLDGGRISVGAQAVGIAQGAIDCCKKYVTEHSMNGQLISKYQYTQFQLADMQTKVDAARLLVQRAAQAKQDGDPFGQYAAMGKLFASETAVDVTRRCIDLVGVDGVSGEYPFERFLRDAKITEIYEGTSEVQRMVISGAMGVK